MTKKNLDKLKDEAEPVKLPPTRKDELQAIKDAQKGRTAAQIFADHQAAFSRPAVKSGWPWLDEHLRFMPTDFNVIQSESNHGKSTFMLNLLYNFAFDTANDKTDCIFITYETSPLRIEERFLNVCAKRSKEGLVIMREREAYSYNDKASFLTTFDANKKEGALAILGNVQLEDLAALIDLYKRPDYTLVLFLDYLQIIPAPSIAAEGWQFIKEVSYDLERLAVDKEIILFAASQVNKQGETREGRDIYNAATHVIDIFNHSHAGVKQSADPRMKYQDRTSDGKAIFSLSIKKAKFSESAFKENYLLFDGFAFEENPDLWRNDR